MSQSPRQFGNASALVDDETVQRVTRLVDRLGVGKAQLRLGVSTQTFAQAREGGRIKCETRDRIVAVLDREEACAASGT